MKIILSPAKKMNMDTDSLAPMGLPPFVDKTVEILAWLNHKSIKLNYTNIIEYNATITSIVALIEFNL